MQWIDCIELQHVSKCELRKCRRKCSSKWKPRCLPRGPGVCATMAYIQQGRPFVVACWRKLIRRRSSGTFNNNTSTYQPRNRPFAWVDPVINFRKHENSLLLNSFSSTSWKNILKLGKFSAIYLKSSDCNGRRKFIEGFVWEKQLLKSRLNGFPDFESLTSKGARL